MKFSRSGLIRYLKNTGWLLLGRMVQLLIGLVVTVSLARFMGPGNFGKLSFALATVFLVSVASQFGMRDIIRKQLLEFPEEKAAILGTYFRLSLLFGLCGYGILLCLILFLDLNGSDAFLYLILGGTILAINLRAPEVFFETRVQSIFRIVPMVSGVALAGVLKITLASQGAGLLWIGSAFLFEASIVTVLLMVLYRIREGPLVEWMFDRTLAVKILRKSSMLLVAAVSVNLMLRLDQVMIGILLGDEAVGIYAVAARMSTIWHMVPTILAASLFPAIMQARKEGTSKYHYRLKQYIKLNTLLSYCVVVFTIVLAPYLIRYLFGAEYHDSIPILMVYIFSSVCVFMHIVRLQYLLAEGLHFFLLISSVTGAVANILLNLLLIPVYGGLGAAVSTILSLFISVFLLTLLYPKTRYFGKMMSVSLISPWPMAVNSRISADPTT